MYDCQKNAGNNGAGNAGSGNVVPVFPGRPAGPGKPIGGGPFKPGNGAVAGAIFTGLGNILGAFG